MKLRLPPDLKEYLRDSADRNGRSLNTEIVLRLQRSAGAAGDEHITSETGDSRNIDTAIQSLDGIEDLLSLIRQVLEAEKRGADD